METVLRGISSAILVLGLVIIERQRMKRPKYTNRPFARLPLKQRACFILYMAGFTTRQIGTLIVTSYVTVSRYIKHGIEEYGEKGVTNLYI